MADPGGRNMVLSLQLSIAKPQVSFGVSLFLPRSPWAVILLPQAVSAVSDSTTPGALETKHFPERQAQTFQCVSKLNSGVSFPHFVAKETEACGKATLQRDQSRALWLRADRRRLNICFLAGVWGNVGYHREGSSAFHLLTGEAGNSVQKRAGL